MTDFKRALQAACNANDSLLCVGLDPDPALMPVADTAAFCKAVIDATKDLVCAYKPNLAFFEAQGISGLQALADTLAHARQAAPDAVVIGDAKRGDIDSTNAMHAKALFDQWRFDAVTVNAFAGGDALAPLLSRPDKGVFVWCRSSNPGAREFQDAAASAPDDAPDAAAVPLYERIAARAMEWSAHANVGLVVGATYPAQLSAVRRLCPGAPLLIPGVGAQGGALEAAVSSGYDHADNAPNIVVSSSRGVLYADLTPAGFAAAARSAASQLRDALNAAAESAARAEPNA